MKKLLTILFTLALSGCGAINNCDFSKEIKALYESRDSRNDVEFMYTSGSTLFYTVVKGEQNNNILIQDFYATGEQYSEAYEVLSLDNVVTNNLWSESYGRQMNGWVTFWYKNNNRLSKSYYRDGIPHGAWEIWSEDGGLYADGFYVNGKKRGLWRARQANGEMKVQRDFGLPSK